MLKITRYFLALLVFLPVAAFAQQPVEMADIMRSNGKIYVVVAVVLVILAGLFVYLFSLDRKVSKLEKDVAEKERQTK